jgi:hypothetical protein
MAYGYLIGVPQHGDAKVPSSKQWINPCHIIINDGRGKLKDE